MPKYLTELGAIQPRSGIARGGILQSLKAHVISGLSKMRIGQEHLGSISEDSRRLYYEENSERAPRDIARLRLVENHPRVICFAIISGRKPRD